VDRHGDRILALTDKAFASQEWGARKETVFTESSDRPAQRPRFVGRSNYG